MNDPSGRIPCVTYDATTRGDPFAPEAIRRLAGPEEVDFLLSAAFDGTGLEPAAVPRLRESMAFLAGMAARARDAGTPFEATWSLVAEIKGLDRLADPAARAFWRRVRDAMRRLASPGRNAEGGKPTSPSDIKRS